MKAIISDIHSNFEALTAVLADIEAQNVTEIYCLGDIVGYGPNPRECVDLIMKCQVVLLGNHDQGAMFDPEGFNPQAERAIFWTRTQLEAPIESREKMAQRWEFLAERPRIHKENGFLYVHGSARNPINEYVFPEDIYNQRKMDRIFALVDNYCFQGHTHVPGVFLENLNDEAYQFVAPEELGLKYPSDQQLNRPASATQGFKLDQRKALINVGSVGQPRDCDWRACYVMLDGNTVCFRRVEYDINTTIKKIHDIPDLDDFLGDRLRDGR